MSFLSAFNQLYTNVRGENETQPEECVTAIPTDTFHFFLLIPSVLMMLLLAFTISRKEMCLDCLWGRPGAVFPMDILGKSNRFSYAAAWGSIAFLAADMVFGNTQIVQLDGPAYVTVFNKILSMLVIGVGYIPMFSALAIQSVIGFCVGTAYAWMLLGVNIFRITECDLVYQARLIYILRDIPNILCLGYLSISLPVRLIQSLRARKVQVLSSFEMVSILNMDKEMSSSPESIHVKLLLKRAPPPPEALEGCSAKLMATIKQLISDWIYHVRKNFRYSARMLSVALIGTMLIYKVTLEVFVFVLAVLKLIAQGFDITLDQIGREHQPGEDGWVSETREGIEFIAFLIDNVRICFIVSLSLTLVAGIMAILHMLSSYRTNLMDLYKGDNTHIPHRSTRSNSSLLVGSMRYAGYQVAYIGWGFVVHFLILFIVCFALCVLITLIVWGFTDWLVNIIATAWPAVAMTVILLLVQTLAAKFAFLQENGNLLAIRNRRVLFTFSFFMFFYNIFIGFLSCILRILKSIMIGAIFLPRLDNSALPRRFQMLDPGFAAYCGFIHVECSHTHPVLVVFLRLLLATKNEKDIEESKRTESQVDMTGHEKKSYHSLKEPERNSKARIRWHLAYTLSNNPALRSQRKSYIVAVRKMQEKIAKFYNLNNTAMGKMAKEMSQVFGAAGVPGQMGSPAGGGLNPAIGGNWNQVLGMSNFLHRLQMDLDSQQGMFGNDNTAYHSDGDLKNNLLENSSSNGGNVFVKAPKNMWKKATLTALTSDKVALPEIGNSETDTKL